MRGIDPLALNRQGLANAARAAALLGALFFLFFLVATLFVAPGDALALAAASLVAVAIGERLGQRRLLVALRARRFPPQITPELHPLLHALASKARLPRVPKLYYLDADTPNALAIGSRSDGSICLSRGLIRLLDRSELAGVLAHELSHIRNGDSLFLGLGASLGRMASFLSLLGTLAILLNPALRHNADYASLWLGFDLLLATPLLVNLLNLSLSRSREFAADLTAAELLGDPAPLASALTKLDSLERHWLTRLFLPYRLKRGDPWLDSHPPTEERIKRLLSLARTDTGWSRPWPATRRLPIGLLRLGQPLPLVHPHFPPPRHARRP